MARPKAPTPTCPICGGELLTEYVYNFETIIGRAGWNMSFEPRSKMCHECSNELLKSAETWFAKRNKTNKNKKFTKENKEKNNEQR